MLRVASYYLALVFFSLAAAGQRDVGEPLFPAYGHGMWGYIDQAGRLVMPEQFVSAREFHEGYACVKANQTGPHTVTFINRKGEMLLPPQFSSCGSFSEGRAAFAVDTEKTRRNCSDCDPFYHWGYVDTSGKIVIAARFHTAKEFSEGLAAVQNDAGKWGFIERSGRVVVPFWFDYADKFSEGLALVVSHKRYGYIDHRGSFVIRPRFPFASKFSEGLAPVRTSGKFEGQMDMLIGDDDEGDGNEEDNPSWAYINKTGKAKIRLKAEFAGAFSEGLARFEIIKPDGYLYCGYLDKSGKPAIQATFGGCEDFSDGLALVLLDGNEKGDVVLNPLNFQVRSFRNGLAVVEDAAMAGPGFGYIDKTGKTIWQPQ